TGLARGRARHRAARPPRGLAPREAARLGVARTPRSLDRGAPPHAAGVATRCRPRACAVSDPRPRPADARAAARRRRRERRRLRLVARGPRLPVTLPWLASARLSALRRRRMSIRVCAI